MADDFDMSELSNGAQDYIRELRKENAKYRTERNDYRDKYADAGEALREAATKVSDYTSFQETHEKTLAEKAAIESKFNRLSVAAEFGIAAHADRLKGSTVEELKTDAASLAETFGKVAPGVRKDVAAGDPPAGSEKPNPYKEAFKRAGL
jgi:hypothetical protein